MPSQPGSRQWRALPVSAVIAAAVLASSAPAAAQREGRPRLRVVRPAVEAAARQPSLDKVFELSSVFGDRDVFEITLGRPGTIEASLRWRGSAERLAVILNGPGQSNAFAREDGASPLSFSFDVTRELFERGRTWTISVVNFSRRGSAVGRVVVNYPPSAPTLAVLSPQLRRAREAVLARPPAESGRPAGGDHPASSEPARSILPDGRVQVRYPDGRTVIYEPGCGFTTILPDGTVSGVQCNQVQPATPPALPSEPALLTFLETHRDHLLQQISTLVDHRQSEIDLYLDYEAKNAAGVLEQIQLRTRLMDKLLR